MYFVSLGGSIGGIVLVSSISDGAALGRIDRDLLRRAVEVAGLAVPVLAFALIHGQLERAAVGAMERLVDVEHRLDGILARRDAVERLARIAECGAVDGDGAGAVHVRAEHLLGFETFADLVARLALGVGGDDQDHVAVHRLLPGDLETQRRLGLGREAAANNRKEARMRIFEVYRAWGMSQ